LTCTHANFNCKLHFKFCFIQTKPISLILLFRYLFVLAVSHASGLIPFLSHYSKWWLDLINTEPRHRKQNWNRNFLHENESRLKRNSNLFTVLYSLSQFGKNVPVKLTLEYLLDSLKRNSNLFPVKVKTFFYLNFEKKFL